MRLKQIVLMLALPLCVGATTPPSAAAPASLPGWMTGTWVETKKAQWTDEYWMPPRGGIMIGASRSGSGEELSSWEAMRIERGADGKLTFWGAPRGEGAVPFALAQSEGEKLVFTNAGHDYPQRISYWREGKALVAEIAMIDGTNAFRWTYQPAVAAVQ